MMSSKVPDQLPPELYALSRGSQPSWWLVPGQRRGTDTALKICLDAMPSAIGAKVSAR
jgi:hypothetical protein